MHAVDFQRKWRDVRVKERSGAQEHFLDVCELVGARKPVEADPAGEFYTFEKGATKSTGGGGWADVWYRGHFGWEYKGPDKDLGKAYDQLLRYKDDLENPPLLVVSDLDVIEVHTNFTDTVKQVHRITTETIAEEESLRVLRALFFAPQILRPTVTPESVTEEAAARFGELAKSIQARGHDPQEIAHFLVQLLFCLFAEDIGLLPNRVFSRLLDYARQNPKVFRDETQKLLEAMGTGGSVAYETIPHFNGGLFRDVHALELTPTEVDELDAASHLDWSQVEPAIFGTLFERSLDPVARARYGIHYTGRDDIARVVDPVVLQPLRRRWETVKAEIASLVERRNAAKTNRIRNDRQRDIVRAVTAFTDELAGVRILDPACGSGNFLYVALKGLLDLEKEVLTYAAAEAGLPMGFPKVGPEQVLGLEINAYAQELAQVVIWIGYLQWMIGNGFGWREPVLRDLDTIRLQDALIDERDGEATRTCTSYSGFTGAQCHNSPTSVVTSSSRPARQSTRIAPSELGC
jgi:type II restriction/modification system DNA methylase subunit YeeA